MSKTNSNKIKTKKKDSLSSSDNQRLVPVNKQPKRNVKVRFTKWLLKWGLILGSWVFSVTLVMLLYYTHDLPDLKKLTEIHKNRRITITAENGAVLTNYGDLYGEYINYEKFPKQLINAVVATEDRRFFEHFGIDIIGIIRAGYYNFTAKRIVQGGSTISQQLAKIAFLQPERTIKRKLQELVLALYLENKFTKKDIITMYLNRVYLGSGIFGVDAAAKYYFGKRAYNLDLFESAMIAGLLKAPSRYSPTNNRELSGKRALQILINMQDAGFISKEQLASAKHHPIILETSALGSLKNRYFANWLNDQVEDIIFNDADSDLVIKSTLDVELQNKVEHAIEKVLTAEGEKLHATQAAMVVLSPNGKILAMQGGRSYDKSPFNRVTQAQRQPGSAFKIFVYLAALENGFLPWSIVEDSPITIKKWRPKNYNREYLGHIPLTEAFAKSLNTVSVKLSETIGRDKVIAIAHRSGITSRLDSHPSIALGSTEVNLLELTCSMIPIKNGGLQMPYYGFTEVKTAKDKILFNNTQPGPRRIIEEEAIIHMQGLLRSVIDEGTGKSAKLSIPAYGKTGTTQDYRDAWFIGYAGNLIAGVWVGNDDNTPMKKVTGGGLPAKIWREFMANSVNHYDKNSVTSEAQEFVNPASDFQFEDEFEGFFDNIDNSVDKIY